MQQRWSRVLRPAAVSGLTLGLMAGVLGAGAGTAGAARSAHHRHRTHHAPHYQSPYKYATYVGGHGKANPKLPPVEIGIVNQQTATNAPVPQWTTGAKVAIKYINRHADGIDGHPLKAVYCVVATSVADAATCGQEFANDQKISAVEVGVVVVGTTALVEALAPSKKPIFVGLGLTTVLPESKDAFVLDGTAWSVDVPIATVAKHVLHAKRVSWIYPGATPVGVFITSLVTSAFKDVGITTFDKVAYTGKSPNFTEPVEASHAATNTLLVFDSPGGPACTDAYQALKSLGLATKVKVLTTATCDTSTIAKADGGQLPKDWYYLSANPLPGSPTKAVKAAQKVFRKFGNAKGGLTAWQTDALGQILTIAKFDTQILKAHEKITPATVTAAAKAFKGPMANGPKKEACGSIPARPGVCGAEISVFQNTAPTVMTPVAYNIGMPKGFKI